MSEESELLSGLTPNGKDENEVDEEYVFVTPPAKVIQLS